MTRDTITGAGMWTLRDLGLDLAALGFVISFIGVLENNVFLSHTTAMLIWCPSNFIFCVYFFGRTRNWWDGSVANWLMCLNYAFMLVSGVWGLKQAGVW
jgi:hypothetical protein